VVVNWNGGEENRACLASIRAQGIAPADVFFVDNASRDGSAEMVEREFAGLRVRRNAANLGFGAAANLGVEDALAAGCEAVMLVNNDVELAPDCLSLLTAAMARDACLGIAAPRVLYKHDRARVWSAGGELNFRQNLSSLLGHGEPDGPRWQRTAEVDYVTGAAMLVRREVFLRVGLFHADYFAYHEDLELCLLAREAGFRVAVVGQAAAWHTASGSTGGGYSPRRKYMIGVNTVWFLRRHGTPARWLSFALFDVLSLPVLLVVELLRGRARGVLAKAGGILDGLRGRRVRADALEPGASWLW
jgi:hypothetical protein